jgi:hypothetical protein
MSLNPHNILSFGLLKDCWVSKCLLQRRYTPEEVYHVLIYHGKEYFMRIDLDGDGLFHFTANKINDQIYSYEGYINQKIAEYDFF